MKQLSYLKKIEVKKFRFLFFILFVISTGCTDFAAIFGAKPESAPADVLKINGTFYIVIEGDTMQSVAEKYSITAYQLSMANGLETDDKLAPGQKLLIPTVESNHDSKYSSGKNKKKKAVVEKSSSKKKNKKDSQAKAKSESSKVESKEAKSKPDEQEYIWPCKGIVTSLMGPRRGRSHDGIDISAPFGAPIVAIKNGTVIFSGRMNGYGNLVIVKHSNNMFSAYAHMSQIKVEKGKKVKQGELLGLVGRTGRASATHLHFEVRNKTQVVDPMKVLPKKDPSQIRHSDLTED